MRRSSVSCGHGADGSVQPVGAQSILSAMDRFVKSVNNMNSTLLVPSKLRDMDLPGPNKNARGIPPALVNADLYSFYEMLNDVKKELLWGSTAGVTSQAAATLARLSQPQPKSHVRQPSDDSLRSLSLGST